MGEHRIDPLVALGGMGSVHRATAGAGTPDALKRVNGDGILHLAARMIGGATCDARLLQQRRLDPARGMNVRCARGRGAG